jgi:hypothetical protein
LAANEELLLVAPELELLSTELLDTMTPLLVVAPELSTLAVELLDEVMLVISAVEDPLD